MRRSPPLILAIPVLAMCAVACAGGGGGGGASLPPPPIALPPAPPRPPLTLAGPSAQAVVSVNSAGVVTDMTAATLTGASQNFRLGIDQGMPASGDETYRVQQTIGATTIDKDFRAADGTVALDTFWSNTRVWSSEGTTFDILDLTNSFSGSLDRLYPVRLAQGGLTMFGVFGTRAGPLPSMLPERYLDATGMAEFRGDTAGYFFDVDKRIWRTRAEMIVRANFLNGTIQGNVGNSEAVALSNPPDPANVLSAPQWSDLDFMFTGQLNTGAMTFDANASGASFGRVGPMTGSVTGTFFGAPGAAADEIGLTFSLANSANGAKHFGVGAGGHQLAPRPFLTPTTVVNMGRGPSVMVSATEVGIFGPRGAGSGVAASTLLNVSPDVWGSFAPGATMNFQDDAFRLRYSAAGLAIDDTFSFFAMPSYTNFGTTYSTFNGQGSSSGLRLSYDHHSIGFDLGPSLAGALNNVFLIALTGDLFDRNQNYGFVVFGTQTAVADMPTTGSASFSGETRGVYLDTAGQFFKTASDLALTANFASGAVNGSATDFRIAADYHLGAPAANLLDFTFNGTIASGTSTFGANAASVAGGLGLAGRVEGAFYGDPGAAPDEAGIAYQLGTPGGGAFMAGAGIMAKQ